MAATQDDHRRRWIAIIEDVDAATKRLAETRRFAERKLRESIDPGRDATTRQPTDVERRTVECARMQAIAYVRGRQDAGDAHTGDSGDFGMAYAARQSQHFAEAWRTMPDIGSAFLEWRKTGEISTGS